MLVKSPTSPSRRADTSAPSIPSIVGSARATCGEGVATIAARMTGGTVVPRAREAWRSTVRNSSCGSSGLLRKSVIPASKDRCRSATSAPAVSAMIGSDIWSWLRIANVAALPSMTGICTSIRTTSISRERSARVSTACLPFVQVRTTAPADSRIRRATSRLMSLSSTTRTRTPASDVVAAAAREIMRA